MLVSERAELLERIRYSLAKLMVMEIFRATACTPGTMYDADVIHSGSPQRNKVVFLWVLKIVSCLFRLKVHCSYQMQHFECERVSSLAY